jgi:hypothetical protein
VQIRWFALPDAFQFIKSRVVWRISGDFDFRYTREFEPTKENEP